MVKHDIQAAIRAGYSKKTAGATGHENLTKPEIQAAIAEAFEAQQERTEVTEDDVVRELARLGLEIAENSNNPVRA